MPLRSRKENPAYPRCQKRLQHREYESDDTRYFTLAKIITSAYTARDSLRARPRTSANRIPARAEGFRARTLVAEAAAPPWPIAQPAHAMAMENPTDMPTQLVGFEIPPLENTGTAKQRADSAINTF